MRPWNSDVNMSINHVENNAGMDKNMQRKQMQALLISLTTDNRC